MIPAGGTINRLMERTGMDRVQAIRHLQDRERVRRLVDAAKNEGQRHDK